MNYYLKPGDRAGSSRIATRPAAISAGRSKSSGSLNKLLKSRRIKAGFKRHFQQVCKIFTKELIVQGTRPTHQGQLVLQNKHYTPFWDSCFFKAGFFYYSSKFGHEVFISTDRCLLCEDSQPPWGKHLEPMTSRFRTSSCVSEDTLRGHKQNENEFRAVSVTHNWSHKHAQYVCTEQKVPLTVCVL